MEQAENENIPPLEYFEQRLRQGEVLHIADAALWYQAAQGLFYLRFGEGNICASLSFGRAIWTLLNNIGRFEPISEKELSSSLYTIQSTPS